MILLTLFIIYILINILIIGGLGALLGSTFLAIFGEAIISILLIVYLIKKIFFGNNKDKESK
jgi:hypothetical protein